MRRCALTVTEREVADSVRRVIPFGPPLRWSPERLASARKHVLKTRLIVRGSASIRVKVYLPLEMLRFPADDAGPHLHLAHAPELQGLAMGPCSDCQDVGNHAAGLGAAADWREEAESQIPH